MYNKNIIYIPELEAQGQKSYVVVWLGGGGVMNAGVLSEPLLRWIDWHVVVVAAYRQVGLEGDKETTVSQTTCVSSQKLSVKLKKTQCLEQIPLEYSPCQYYLHKRSHGT